MMFSLLDVENALRDCSSDVKGYTPHTYAALEKQCPRAMRGEPVPNNYLSTRARTVYKYAQSNQSLIALQKGLYALYCYAAQSSPKLIPPLVFFPLDDIETVVTEKSPVFALQEALNDALVQALQKNDSHSEAFSHALSLAKRLKITSSEKLLSALNKSDEQLIIFKNLKAGIMTIATERHYLDSFSLLHLRKAKEMLFTSKSLKNQFSAFLSRATPSQYFSNCSLDDALNALSFTERAMTRNNLLGAAENLSTDNLIKALAGQTVQLGENKDDRLKVRKKKRLEIQDKKGSDTRIFKEFDRLAFNSAPSGADEHMLKRFSLTLDELAFLDPDGKRDTRAFNLAQKSLMQLVYEAGRDTHSISFIAYLLLYYLTDQFLLGTKFGNILAVSSVITYRSTLLNYIRAVWTNEDDLQLAQNNDDALLELSELAADALGDTLGQDKQNTILHFMSFINDVSPYRLFDVAEMEYLGAPVTRRRAHYIAQSDFEAACSQFINEDNAKERQHCALKMKLCYYGGLRSSEADNLRVRDINFDADVLYVTRLVKRKSLRSVRRVPLCFFPTRLLNEVSLQIGEKKSADSKLLEQHAKSYLETRFIAILRECCGESSLVIHSLRHAAANNMMTLLSTACFHQVHAARQSVFFLSQKLFNDEQLHRVKLAFKAQGRELTPFFPILDAVGVYLGHVCAAVTVSNYLHLLDFLLFIIEQPNNQRAPTSYVKSLMANNNHLFEQLKRYENALMTSPEKADSILFKLATHGLEANAFFDKLIAKIPEKSATISFRSYLSAIDEYQTESRSSLLTDELKQHLVNSRAARADISFISSLSSRQFPTFLRFCEKMTHTVWSNADINALQSFLEALAVNQVSKQRKLIQYLRSLKLIGINDQRIQFYSAKNGYSGHWASQIKRFGHTVETKDDQLVTKNFIITKPVYSRYSLWPHLQTLVSLVLNYVDFKEK